MNKVPLINGVFEYLKNENAPFSMPGHKMGRAFEDEFFKKFLEDKQSIYLNNILLRGDLTEVEGLDNLHKPDGIIKEAQDELSKLYKSNKSYFLVNGSTSGNLIMIFSAFNEGDKILVERNCHRSIMNGIIMNKLEPIFIKNVVDKHIKAPLGIDIHDLKDKLDNNDDIKGIILTYPNYYGVGIMMDSIIKECKDRNLKILIDSAHGAHFGFNKKLPKSAQDLGADIVVMSAHKTLPSLTQTAYIHVNNKDLIEKVEFYKEIFMSTSPSYMFMMTLDYSRAFLQYKGEEEYDKLISRINKLFKSIDGLNYLENFKDLVKKAGFKEFEIDNSRIVLTLKNGYSGHKLAEYLLMKNIQCEMSDDKNVVLIPSPFNTEEEFEKLTKVLRNCDCDILRDEEKSLNYYNIPKAAIKPSQVVGMESEYINYDKSIGKIAAQNIVPYPPGVPLIVMGEILGKDHIDIINRSIKGNVTLMGVKDNKIKVIKE